jgi:hypothetical protein
VKNERGHAFVSQGAESRFRRRVRIFRSLFDLWPNIDGRRRHLSGEVEWGQVLAGVDHLWLEVKASIEEVSDPC